jgi:hypothetical protein
MAAAWAKLLGEEGGTLSAGIGLHPPSFPLAQALRSAAGALEAAKGDALPRGSRLCLLDERLTWEQAEAVGQAWRELAALARGGLPVAAVRALAARLEAPAEPEAEQRGSGSGAQRLDVLEAYLRQRGLLLYTLQRNAPRREQPAFWEWADEWLTFDPVRPEEREGWRGRLQALRVAVPLALWSLREGGRGDG